jgi:hypothetical protein
MNKEFQRKLYLKGSFDTVVSCVELNTLINI